jgi:phenylacetate-CoA ligase
VRKFLVKHFLYPLHELAKGQKTTSVYQVFRGREWWPVSRLQEFQLNGLRRLLHHAYEHAPFYRERFDVHGVSPDDLKTIEDIRRFPFLTKDQIRASRELMVTVPASKRSLLVPFSTGGSTGEPVRFYIDRGRIASEWAACWRARSWWGLDWGDSWFWLWGSPIELTAEDRIRARLKRLRDTLLSRKLLSAFDMTETTMAQYAELVRRTRPKYIYSYSSAAYLLAEFILKNKIDLSDSAPCVVFTTADTLYPHMRNAITQAFHCPVSIEYGSRDGGFVAHECPAGGLHVHADRVYLEIIRGDQSMPPGELGEIVLTSLDATAMPFVRYRTGDVGALDPAPCRCGRSLPLLKSIEGRSSDYLLARGNRLIYGGSITSILTQFDGIARFRLLQDEIDHLCLEIVKTHPNVELPLDQIQARIQRLFRHPVSVEFRFVESLAPTGSGKYRLVISKLTGRYFEMIPSPHIRERSS